MSEDFISGAGNVRQPFWHDRIVDTRRNSQDRKLVFQPLS
jgi:hypothetical protein